MLDQVAAGWALLGDAAAGGMWSVVTESPSNASTRAPRMSAGSSRFVGDVLEEGGSCTYVESSRHSSMLPEGTSSPASRSSPRSHGVFLTAHGRVDRGLDGCRTSSPLARCHAGKCPGRSDRIHRLGCEIEIDRPGQRVGHHQRWKAKAARTCEWMRPSKLRFPESTAETTSPFSSTARLTGSGSGPELPMQVVQP